jgi:hypothetical protein
VSELAARSELPAGQDAAGYGQLLGKYLEVRSVEQSYQGARPAMVITGAIRTPSGVHDAAEVRRSFLDSLDAVLAILAGAGARHFHHPELVIHGQALVDPVPGAEFTGIECLVRISLYREVLSGIVACHGQAQRRSAAVGEV